MATVSSLPFGGEELSCVCSPLLNVFKKKISSRNKNVRVVGCGTHKKQLLCGFYGCIIN